MQANAAPALHEQVPMKHAQPAATGRGRSRQADLATSQDEMEVAQLVPEAMLSPEPCCVPSPNSVKP